MSATRPPRPAPEPEFDPADPLAGLMPADPLMAIMWADSLRFALGRPDMLAAFREATGNRWEPGRTPLDRAIDKAAGAEADFFREFARWHNAWVWGEGPDGGPIDVSDSR